MASARAERIAAHYLPSGPGDDDNDLDHRLVCPHCRQPYEVVGAHDARRIQPTHKTWCRRYRPTSKETTA